MSTSFEDIYDRFLGKITDDMYMELTPEDTNRDLQALLVDAIPGFEFPRFPLYDYDTGNATYGMVLTSEEINILAQLMLRSWLQRQVASVESTRMKYSGSDFKMTSQANHLDKLMKLKIESEKNDRHYQRLYKRRKTENGQIKSNWACLREKSALE